MISHDWSDPWWSGQPAHRTLWTVGHQTYLPTYVFIKPRNLYLVKEGHIES